MSRCRIYLPRRFTSGTPVGQFTIEGCPVVDDGVMPGYFDREHRFFFAPSDRREFPTLWSVTLATTQLADAFLLIDVILKAAQRSRVPCMCYDRALPHLNVAISKSPFYDVYHVLITQRSRGFSLFKLFEFNATKEKSKGYLTYSILTVRSTSRRY